MSRSFRGRPDPGEENLEPAPDDYQNPRGARSNSPSRYSSDNFPEPHESDEEQPEKKDVDIGKRLVAGLIDVMAGYVIGMIVNCIPFINTYLQDTVVMVGYLCIRDGLFNGRGIGKNLMGLQVIDVKTGHPASFVQSIKRNIVVFGPYLALFIVSLVLRVIPNAAVNTIVSGIVTGAGQIYTLLVIPYEIYRVYSRPDGLRWGDQFAGTATRLADMDFSNPISKQR